MKTGKPALLYILDKESRQEDYITTVFEIFIYRDIVPRGAGFQHMKYDPLVKVQPSPLVELTVTAP